MLAKPSFFRAHGAAVAQREHFLGDLLGCLLRVARFAQLDEPGVLSKSAGIEVERNSVLTAESETARAFSIDTGLPAAELLVTVSITSGMRARPTRAINALSASKSMLPLKGRRRAGLPRLGRQQIDRLGPGSFDVGARGVEVRIVRTTSPGLHIT